MAVDILRIEANERVDLQDVQSIVDASVQQASHPVADLIANPAGQRMWILAGFAPTAPYSNQVSVTKGRAILARREGGDVFYGLLTTEGDALKSLSTGGFATGTYGIYIRFEFVDGNTGARIFWNPTGTGFEYSQTMATTRVANWSLKIEGANPGVEWLKIGQVAITSGSISSLTDMRPMFFEGRVDQGYATGWGSGAHDRDANRQQYGVGDFQTFTAAMRQSIEDIKGRGLKRWWDAGIGGMNIGFDTNPTANTLYIHDANRGFDFSPSLGGTLKFGNDGLGRLAQIQHAVTPGLAGSLYFNLANATRLWLTTNQATGIGTTFGIGDQNFNLHLDNAGTPQIVFDTNDFIQYDRANNIMRFAVGNANGFWIELYGPHAQIYYFGQDRSASIGCDPTTQIPFIEWDSGDRLTYARATNEYQFSVNGVNVLKANTTGTTAPLFYVKDDQNFAIYFESADLPTIGFGGARFRFHRSANQYEFVIGNSVPGIVAGDGFHGNILGGYFNGTYIVASGGITGSGGIRSTGGTVEGVHLQADYDLVVGRDGGVGRDFSVSRDVAVHRNLSVDGDGWHGGDVYARGNNIRLGSSGSKYFVSFGGSLVGADGSRSSYPIAGAMSFFNYWDHCYSQYDVTMRHNRNNIVMMEQGSVNTNIVGLISSYAFNRLWNREYSVGNGGFFLDLYLNQPISVWSMVCATANGQPIGFTMFGDGTAIRIFPPIAANTTFDVRVFAVGGPRDAISSF